MKRLRATFIACFLVALLAPQSAKAIYLGAPTSDYGIVGAVTIQNGFYASATLIADRWVLTAGHVAASDGVSHFYYGGALLPIERAYVHPLYDRSTLAHDIGLFELQAPVVGAELPTLFNGIVADTSASGYLGQEATLVGWGANNALNFTGEGVRRKGNNDIDQVDASFIGFFAQGGEATMLPGDSGGASFADFGLGEVLIGVHSFVLANLHSYDVRVDLFRDWIDAKVGAGVVRWGNGTFVAQVPEPAPLFLMLSGLLLLAFRRKS